MKNLLVPLSGTNDEPSNSNNNNNSGSNNNNNNCNFHKDALLGFAIELPDEQLDNAVIQLQAAAAQQNTNKNNSNNSSNKNNNTNNNNNNTNNNNNNNNTSDNSANYHQSMLHCELPDCYQFDGAAAASELVNVANKNCDSLAKLAYNLYRLAKDDHIVIDRKRNEVVRTNALTNQKTIYRCMDPVGMGMCSTTKEPPFSKASRPRKRTATAAATTTSMQAANIAAPSGAIKKTMNEPMPAADADDSMLRTRSGRIVRAALPQSATPTPSSGQMLEMLVAELRDKDYCAPSAVAATPAASQPATAPAAVADADPVELREPRAVPQNAICPGCSKIFLGRRLQRHYVKFPEHMPSAIAVRQQQQLQQQEQPQAQHQQQQQPQHLQQQQQQPQLTSSVPTLFDLLTGQLQRHSHLSEEQRADLFLHELNDFVEQLQLRSTRLIRNTSGLHFVNARIARVLGIPEGQYALDMSAMESAQAPTPEPELQQLLHTGGGGVAGVARNLVDYPGLSMSLDDTLTDEAAQRLNLSAGGKLLPPSEESLLRNVGDLMQPPVAVVVAPPTVGHVVAGAMLPHYDHASDNAVEALSMKETPNAAILDLNVDFFQFNNN